MSQQINLLPPRTRDILLPAGIAGLVLVVAAAAMYIGSSTSELSRTRDRLAQAQQRANEIRTAVAKLQPAGRGETRPQLEAEIAQLKQRADAANEFLIQVDSGAFGKAGGYPAHFSALASSADENVWLSRVTIGRGGRPVLLSGSATSNEAVLHYARRAGDQFRGAGVNFRSLEIRAAPAGAAPTAAGITFTLS